MAGLSNHRILGYASFTSADYTWHCLSPNAKQHKCNTTLNALQQKCNTTVNTIDNTSADILLDNIDGPYLPIIIGLYMTKLNIISRLFRPSWLRHDDRIVHK